MPLPSFSALTRVTSFAAKADTMELWTRRRLALYVDYVS